MRALAAIPPTPAAWGAPAACLAPGAMAASYKEAVATCATRLLVVEGRAQARVQVLVQRVLVGVQE
jgi:hypothetical protein